jgi:hypothetical protein
MGMEVNRIPEGKRRSIESAFSEVIDSALPIEAQHKAFDPTVWRFVKQQVERLSYSRLMRFGRSDEDYFVDRFSKVARIEDKEFEDRGLAVEMAHAYRSTHGRGYVLRKLAAARASGGTGLIRKWVKKAQAYRKERQHLLGWFYEQLVAGEPFVITDFEVEPKYSLIRDIRGEEEHIRMVKLSNGRHELTPLLKLNAEEFSEPRSFRKWCLKNGNFTFGVGGGAGITELNQLQLDINCMLYGRTVVEQCEYGWREVKQSPEEKALYEGGRMRSGLWFFRDGVCSPTGKWLKPDVNGIVEWNGSRFRLGETSYDDQSFAVSTRPEMRVDMSFQDVEFETSNGLFRGEGKKDEEVAGALFRELYVRLKDTLGSEVAGYVLGMMLNYASAPEIYGERGEFPGLWLHGKAGSGKSCLAAWVMEIWGFREMKPLILKGTVSTAVGLNIALSQISNLPLWGDEFRVGEVGQDKLAVLHNAFNRGRGIKWSQPGMERRAPRTSFIVSGETTSTDAATRGRYAHALVADNLRQKNHMVWFQNTAPLFAFIGRYLLEHRRTFVEMHLRTLDSWMTDRTFELKEERQRFVYGSGFSAFFAAVTMFKSHDGAEVRNVRLATIQAAEEGVADVTADIAVNQFWQDLVTLHAFGDLHSSWVRFKTRPVGNPPGSPAQLQWEEVTMYLKPSPVIAAINRMRAQGRGDRGLEQKDLVAQMGPEPYWVNDKKKRRYRFGGGTATSYCWCIRLDCHPLGYQAISDEEWLEYIDLPSEVRGAKGDPRRGELYALLDSQSSGDSSVPEGDQIAM